MNVDIVFQGGGVLGISYIGVLKALDERKYKIKRCAGTSAGSIIAALTMAGYSWKELYEIVKNTDFNIFMKKTNLSRFFYLGKVLSVIFNKGIYDSSIIENWMQQLLEKKGITKFEDLCSENKSNLKIVSADITSREIFMIPDDLKEYNLKLSEFNISKAVRMSSAIPFFFTPVVVNANGKINYVVDGGLLSNFPIWTFDVEGIPRWPTFGVKLIKNRSLSANRKTGILSYFMDVVKAPLNYDSSEFVRNKDKIRTIEIEIDKNISATDFKKSNECIDYLYNKGYEAALKFIDGWNFDDYIEKYRKKEEFS